MVPADVPRHHRRAGLRRVKARLDELVLVLGLPGGDVELRRGPVELVVRAHRRRRRRRPACRARRARSGFVLAAAKAVSAAVEAARREGGIELSPEARRLRGRRRQVQGRGGADGPQVALDVVVGGRGRNVRPLLAVDLLMNHPGHRLPRRHLQPQEEIEPPARLVEQVGAPVLRLGDLHLPVAERRRRRAEARERLVLVLQHPDGEAAVDDVLAVIAGVVPAAAGVERVVAVALRRAGDALVAEVAGRALEGGRARVRHLDRDAAALQVEERQRVVLQPPVDVRRRWRTARSRRRPRAA